MNQIDKQPHELDRWENEGGALPAEKASDGAPAGLSEKALLPLAGREVVQVKIGPTRPAAHDRFFANLKEVTANNLKNLEATGGHGEAHTELQREKKTVLARQHFSNRATYRANLVNCEITNAGRQHARGLSS